MAFVDTLPRHAIAAFCRRNSIKRLAVFGSALRVDFRPDSDLDVLVDYEPGARVGFLAMGRAARELSDLVGRRVDLVPQDGLKPALRSEILAEAEVLFAA